jgi:hypothetical protein
MAVDHETVGVILEKLDEKFAASTEERRLAFKDIYRKIDDHAERADARLDRHAEKTEAAVSELCVKTEVLSNRLSTHIDTSEARFRSIDAAARRDEDIVSEWKQTGVKILFGSATVAAIWEWLRGGFRQ